MTTIIGATPMRPNTGATTSSTGGLHRCSSMRRSFGVALARGTLAVALAGCSGGGGTESASGTPSAPGNEPTYYLSLGDSAAAGVQPLGGVSNKGYADQLLDLVRAAYHDL